MDFQYKIPTCAISRKYNTFYTCRYNAYRKLRKLRKQDVYFNQFQLVSIFKNGKLYKYIII